MHWIPFVLMLIAAIIFMLAHWNVPRAWVTQPLGLFFLTVGLMAQFIIAVDGYRVLVD